MKNVGVLVLINVLIVVIFMALQGSADWKRLTFIALFGLFVGITLILQDRITGIKVAGVGEISSVVAQATADAEQVRVIRVEMEKQRDSLAMVVRDANDAQQKIEQLAKISKQAAGRLNAIENIQSDANQLLTGIRDLSHFSSLIVQANNDERSAFEQLVKTANSQGSNQQIASTAVGEVLLKLDPFLNVRIDPEVPWKSLGIDPKKSSFEELQRIYPNLWPPQKPSFLIELWTQDRFAKGKRLQFMADVIQNESSLRALNRACIMMNMEAHIDMNILGTQQYLNWWQTNKGKYDFNK